MTIEKAIKALEYLKSKGTKSIVLAVWEAKEFSLTDDKDWNSLSEILEMETDWSCIHSKMQYLIDEELEA
jgi:hypothetical protein